MATHKLDELECDEIYHALLERKTTLEKRIKDLSEKDGLPEAAEAVRERLGLYNPNGEGKAARPGLIRQFGPQRDFQTDTRTDEQRDPAGGQDTFGGGVETGGAPRADAEKKTRGKRGKGKRTGEADGDTLPIEAEAAEAEYEIIEEGRRLPAGTSADAAAQPETKEQADALDRLASIADGLLAGRATIEPDEFDAEGKRVLELIRAAGPLFADDAAERAETTFAGEYRDSDENAHHLARFVVGMIARYRQTPDAELPIGNAPESSGGDLSFAPPAEPPVFGGPIVDEGAEPVATVTLDEGASE